MKISNFLKKGYEWIRSISIFKRLVISFFIVILIPAFIVIGILYRNVENEFYKTGLNYLNQNLDNTVQKTYEVFHSYENEIIDFVREENIETLLLNGETEEIKKVLISGKEKLNCDNIFVITQKELIGNERMAVLAQPDQFRESEVYKTGINSSIAINWFNTIRENTVYYTNSNKGSYMGNYLTLTAKLLQNGQTAGLLVINMDIARMSALADIDKVYNQDQFLIDKDGLITYLNIDYVYREYPKWIWSEAAKRNEEIISCNVMGKDTLFMTKSVGKNDWKVVTAIIKDNILEASYELRNQQLVIVCITIFISFIFCILVTLSISYPLKKIKAAMKQYARHDFDLDLQDVGRDEITEVSTHFQDMSQRIGELAEKEVLASVKQREMEFSALQMQINPHFLYNTLDLIRWNVMDIENGNDRVSKMIGNYSTMLHYNIRLEDGYATIEQEIEYTKKYINLLNMLYQIEINLEVITEYISIQNTKIGKLFFQPIIENAVIHGKLNKQENPIIRILMKQDKELTITIQNNGKPMTAERMEALNAEFMQIGNNAERVGLYNVNQRIKLLFGEEYGLKAMQEDNMTCFVIRLPNEENR